MIILFCLGFIAPVIFFAIAAFCLANKTRHKTEIAIASILAAALGTIALATLFIAINNNPDSLALFWVLMVNPLTCVIYAHIYALFYIFRVITGRRLPSEDIPHRSGFEIVQGDRKDSKIKAHIDA